MIKTVRFTNLSPHPRREYGLATIPFRQGEWFGASSAASLVGSTDSRPFYLRAFGAKYADNSYRYGQAYIPLVMDGDSQRQVQLNVESTPGASPPQLTIPVPLQFAVPVIVNGAQVPPQSMMVEQIENNVARSVLKIRYRTGNFVVVIHLYLYKEQDVFPFEVRVIGSNPQNNDLVYPVNNIILTVPGSNLGVYGAERRGAQRIDAGSYLLTSNTSFGDGQSQCWYGTVYLGGSAPFTGEVSPLWGISLDWREAKAFGPYGTIPAALTDNPSLKLQAVNQTYTAFRQFRNSAGALWNDFPLGLSKSPSATGDQRDFSMMSGWDAMDSGHPELLEIYRFNAVEEAMRPGHYMETNGTPVTHAAHPNWVSWSGQTHWHPNLSPDKLGKVGVATESQCNSWLGKDNEHWSSNMLSAAAVLTNTYQLMDEVNTEAELFLSGHTIPSMKPGWSTNQMFAARAIGRTYHAMAQNYLITGREDIRTRVLARTNECVLPQWAGRTTNPVRPLKTIGPDGRQLPLYPSWLPWQEALGAPGLESWYQITGLAVYRQLAVIVAANMVKWGWRITMDGTQIASYDVGNAVRWYEDGTPITPEQYFDTTQTYYNPSGIMSSWTVTTLKLVKEY